MTTQSLSRASAALLVVAGVSVLAGCAAASGPQSNSGPQSLSVEWSGHFGDSAMTTTVDFGEVTCSDLTGDGKGTIESVELQGYPKEPTFRAADVGGGIGNVHLNFDDIYVFSSSDPFTIEDGSITFDEQKGTVALNSGGERVVDSEATLSGTVSC